jgi:uncharacterized protein (DUF983 family)
MFGTGLCTVDVHTVGALHGPVMFAVLVTVVVAVGETVTVKVTVACAPAARWTVADRMPPVIFRLVQSPVVQVSPDL